MNKVIKWICKEKIILAAALIIGIICSTKVYSDTVQAGIAEEVIRFHVLANSDSDDDQALKLKVRDGVLDKYHEELSGSDNKEETRKIIMDNIDGITKCAGDIIKSEGFDYDVKAYMTKDDFPTKVYGDISLPAGEYEALRIEIGKAEGHNWWCVMFPPLCYVDVSCNEVSVDDKKVLENVLNYEEYKLVTEDTPEVKVKFKIVEWWKGN